MTCPPPPPPRGYDTFGRSAKRESSSFAHQNATLAQGLYRMAIKPFKSLLNLKTGRLPYLAPWLALSLTGCISATGPILGDAKAILGDRIQVHAFASPKDGTRDYSTGIFEWSGSRYVRRSGDFTDFTIHPYEGRDLIIQSQASRGSSIIDFGLARRIAEGVYLIIPIQEEDADEPTRSRFCTKTQGASCRISTPEQLFVFARATAARDEDNGGVAVVVAAPRR